MDIRHRCEQAPAQLSAAMREWYATQAGEHLLGDIRIRLDEWLPEMFGYHAVQIGCLALHLDLLADSRIKHRVCVDIDPRAAGLVADAAALPFDADCIDLIVLMHTLDFAAEPHSVLREVERILIPEGHLIVVGFNPWSLYGLWRLILGWWNRFPWCGHFYSGARLKDWLTLLGFVTETCDYLGFRPPIQRARLLQRLAPMERVGRSVFPMLGGVRLLVARKRVATLTPLKPSWQQRRGLMPGKLAEPSARMCTHAQSR
jgi:SAM-dependent methyltransferase